MRLICPNCDAQYEVDAAVIPDGGRDVQCSSCGHTWFQTALTPEPTDDEDSNAVPAAATPPEPEGMRRRNLDEAVLAVLREEAEREARARQAEGSTLETQADLGLTAPAAEPPAPVPAVDMTASAAADSHPDHDHPVETALVARASRRELLPDIEEINSTLRPTSERGNEPAAMDAPETLRQRRNGFRRGFVTSLSVMSLLLLPYIFADGLAQALPASAPAIKQYSAAIDGLRTWLESSMKSTTESLRNGDSPSG